MCVIVCVRPCVCVCVRACMHVRERITTHYGEEGTPLKIKMPTGQFMLLNQAIQNNPEHSHIWERTN